MAKRMGNEEAVEFYKCFNFALEKLGLNKLPYDQIEDLRHDAFIKVLEKNIPKKAWISYCKLFLRRAFNPKKELSYHEAGLFEEDI